MPLLEKDGLRVEYHQSGEGPDLLLLHSLLTEMNVFARVLPALEAKHRVTRINLPGFGASAPVALDTVAAHADHVARVMDALALPATTDVFGNGFGAFVALELAARHGARMGRLLVADALAAFPEPARAPFRGMAERVRAGGMAAVLDTAIGRMFPPEFAAAYPAVIDERKRALAAVEPQCFARACLALAGLDLGDRLGAIRNPVLIMCGALDQTTPAPLARALAGLIPGARYEEIPGSGHCPMLEQPDALVRLIEGFRLRSARLGRYDIRYVDEGRGFPLLLIHGLAGDHSGWAPQIEAWRKRYRVIAPDNRGAGASTQVDEPVSTENLARDMLALLERLGVPRAHVVGRSMGGAVAQHMALLAPARVHTLTLCASFAKFDAYGARVLANMREVLEITGSWEAHARHSVQNFVSPAFYDAHPERVAAIERLIGGETRLQACYVRQNAACLAHDTLARMQEIRCPVQILAGGRDPICPLPATRRMSERLPHAESVIFEDSSHFFLMEEPERFMRVMDAWLERHAPGG